MAAVEEPTDIAAVQINGEGEDIDFRQSYKSVAFVAAQLPRSRFLAAIQRYLGNQAELEPCIAGRDSTCQPVKRTDRQPAHNRIGEAEARTARYGIHAE